MNDCHIFTERGLYCGGEIVYGAVYIDICNPTGATSFDLSLTSYETFCINEEKTQQFKNKLLYMSYNICDRKGPFPIGSYVFPFKIQLPENLPATFFYTQSDTEWRISVSHVLRVRAQNVASFKCRLPLVIYQHNTEVIGEPIASEGLLQLNQFPGMRKGDLKVSAILNKPVFQFGEKIFLSMELTNETKKSVDQITVQLMRHISVTHAAVGQPMTESSVLWGMTMPGSDPEVVKRGFDDLNVEIPLPGSNDFTPTSTADSIKCTHNIVISVASSGDKKLTVEVPVTNILPHDNDAWTMWKPPFWISHCKPKITNTPLQVSPDEIVSFHFSGIPVLRKVNTEEVFYEDD